MFPASYSDVYSMNSPLHIGRGVHIAVAVDEADIQSLLDEPVFILVTDLHDAAILRPCSEADLVVSQRFGPLTHAVRLVISVSSLTFIPVSFRSLGGCDAVSVHACSCAGFPIPCLGRFPWFLL